MDSMPGGVAFYIVTRLPQSVLFRFQKLPEVCSPFGLDRSPPSQFVVRLRNFPPHLRDLLIVAQTTSTDIGLFSRSREPLSTDQPREKISNVFTTSTMANDSLRASLPLSDDGDTSPIGVAVDLSAREKVRNPIPSEEIDESPHPLPNYMVLNNEGTLSSWWVMYTDSIRLGTIYPSLAAAGGVDQKLPGSEPSPIPSDTPMQTSAPPSALSSTPTFGQPSVGQSSTPANILAPPKWNAPSGLAATPTFGSSSSLGPAKASWASGSSFGGTSTAPAGGPTFGHPSFGSATPMAGAGGPSFGAPAGLGSKTSPWASSGTTGATFGQSGGMGMGSGTQTFGASTGNTLSGSGGFGSYAKSGGFSGLAAAPAGGSAFASSGDSPFAKPAEKSPFGKPDSTFGKPAANSFGKKGDSPFGKLGGSTSFGSSMDVSFVQTPQKPETVGLFGNETGGFKLGSSFKGDGRAATDGPKPTTLGTGGFSFGGLSDALKPSATPDVKEESMDEEPDEPPAPLLPSPAKSPPPNPFSSMSTPPPSSQPKAPLFPTTAPLFGTHTEPDTTPAKVQESKPAPNFTFPPSTTPQDTPLKPAPSSAPTSPKIKTEPPSDDDMTPAATPMPPNYKLSEPVPPAATSKTEYTAGDISRSSSEISRARDDAPLPPDFLTMKKPTDESRPPLPDESEDEEGTEDFEDSGDDVTKELSPTDEPTQDIKFSPESSFGTTDRSPLGGSFTKVTPPKEMSKPRPLFGEVGSNSMPIFPPPTTAESPRSPSPIRSAIPPRMLRPDSSRSVSAPPGNVSAINERVTKFGRSPLAREPTPDERKVDELNQQRIAQEQSSREAEKEKLFDDEDERVREELSTDIEATKDLGKFVYHQDYAQEATKPGIPGQIELLYRDINSMIDNLGINARTLESWMIWQMENYAEVDEVDTGRLDIDPDDWCLDQVEELPVIADTISKDLEAGRLKDMRP
jgi:nucleoporin NUP159